MRITALKLIICALLWTAALPAPAQDTTTLDNVVVKTLKKPKEAFFATATMTATDNSNPPNGLNDAPFSGGIADKALNPNWKFDLKFSNRGGYINNNPALGFADAGLVIDGTGAGFGHLNPPHLGENANNTKNAVSDLKDIPYGANNAQFVSAMSTVKHPGFKDTHFDTFGVRGTITAQLGPPNRLVAPIDVAAIHSNFDPTQNPFFSLFHAAVASAARTDFDKSTGTLALRIGPISVLDTSGGQTGGIDPLYANDPVRFAQWIITGLSFLGLGADGFYHFGPGSTEFIDPSGRFHLVGSFDEFFIDSTPDAAVSAFGQFSYLTVADVGTESAGQSRFLRDLMGIDVFQDGVDEDTLEMYGGVVLSLGNAAGLLAATQGFTLSAFDVPSSITLAALQVVPEPPSALLAGIGLLILLAVRAGRRTVATLVLSFCSYCAMADTITFTNPTFPRDTPQRFFASGTLTSTDTNNPPNGIGEAPFISVQGPNKNWRFRITHNDNGLLAGNAGFKGARLGITGTKSATETVAAGHLVPPPGAAHAGETANSLRETSSDRSDIRFGANEAKFVSGWATEKHAKHFDAYGIRSTITAVAGPPLQLTGVADIVGIHASVDPEAKLDFNDKPIYDPFKEALASTAGSGSKMSYDALAGKLRLFPGRIDVLDNSGGQTGGIIPLYTSDPFLSAIWTVSDLDFLGMDPQGDFHFGGGSLAFADPAGRFSVSGAFDELVFPGITSSDTHVGLGFFTDFSVSDSEGSGASAFLRDLVGVDMFFDGLSDAEVDRWAGLMLTIDTLQNFARLTNGFSLSAFDVPATFLISAAAVSEPDGVALFATALLLCALVRVVSTRRKLLLHCAWPGRRLSWRGVGAAAVLITAASSARAITIDITDGLDPDDFGVPAAVINGVLTRASELWQAWLPTNLITKPADHPQNAQFEVLISGADIDDTGANPANTMIFPMARPTGDVPILIEINTDDDAVGAMFWDTTPKTTTPAEFSIDLGLGAGKWKAVDGDLGFGKFDMLTVLLHELGHALGFSRDYSDFADWADDTWNPAHPENMIGTPAHFSDDNNLMSNAAGFAPDGKSGRSFIQPGDVLAFSGAFGYMPAVPEPSTLLLLAAALFAAAALRIRRVTRCRVAPCVGR